MPNSPLDVGNRLARISLIPTSIEVLGHDPELNDEVARQVLWLDFASLLLPEPKQRILVITHDDPGGRAADEGAAAP